MASKPNQHHRDQRKNPRQPGRERERESNIAEDRGRNQASNRRDFASDREADELGSEIERETGIDEDDEDMDETGRRDR
jgi:hypothetical protein